MRSLGPKCDQLFEAGRTIAAKLKASLSGAGIARTQKHTAPYTLL